MTCSELEYVLGSGNITIHCQKLIVQITGRAVCSIVCSVLCCVCPDEWMVTNAWVHVCGVVCACVCVSDVGLCLFVCGCE